MNRFIRTMSLLVLALLVPAAAGADIYSYTSHVDVKSGSSVNVVMTVIGKPETVQWNELKGYCYTHQFATALVSGWKRDSKGRPYWDVTIKGNRPGFCDMYFKGGGGELRIGVSVHR